MGIMALSSSQSSADGLRYSRQRLEAFAKGARGGKRVFAVFDVDNTLMDTRYRTRAALASFLRKPLAAALRSRGLLPARLADLGMGKLGYDGRQTARRLQLGEPEGSAFRKHWERFFWAPRNLRFDRPIKETVALAREAHALGIEVIYLTGRYTDRRRATVGQLRRAGLPNADWRHVIAKPRGKETASFKAAIVRALEGKGDVALFLSDAHADVDAVQKTTRASAAAVLVDFPVGPSGAVPKLKPGTPRIRVR